MNSEETKSDWFKKGATLSDKSARKEFGITQEEILGAIREGTLQYHVSDAHGNPYLKLLRSEVEAFVTEKYGPDYVVKRKIEKELAQIQTEVRKLKTQIAVLGRRKGELLERLNDMSTAE